MMDWKQICVSPSSPILQVLEVIDSGALQIALVVDREDVLLGTVTDGDIRRGLLRGERLDSPVSSVMNPNPIVASSRDGRQKIYAMMRNKKLRQIPILDDRGRVIKVELLENLMEISRRSNWVVLMAGGLGTRLSPLTDECPKPLLKVGTKPILEIILENFIELGFYRFYLTVNYKAEMIMDYFGDGSKWGVEIRYIRETMRMGTAGSLSLLEETPTEPMIVMNGDLLTKVNFQQLLDYHIEHQAVATMCVREYEFQVPYGVVQVEGHRLESIKEKPVQRFFISGGIYVIDPKALAYIPKKTFYDMPSLFEKLLEERLDTAVFPIREYWIDIGRMDDFQRANMDVKEGIL
jgi:dTDP-glucose pyrophosphorylase